MKYSVYGVPRQVVCLNNGSPHCSFAGLQLTRRNGCMWRLLYRSREECRNAENSVISPSQRHCVPIRRGCSQYMLLGFKTSSGHSTPCCRYFSQSVPAWCTLLQFYDDGRTARLLKGKCLASNPDLFIRPNIIRASAVNRDKTNRVMSELWLLYGDQIYLVFLMSPATAAAALYSRLADCLGICTAGL